MEAIVYAVASSFPFWAVPIGIILLELANRARIRKERKNFFIALSFAFIFFAGSGAFFYFGGHKNIAPVFRAYREGRLEWFK